MKKRNMLLLLLSISLSIFFTSNSLFSTESNAFKNKCSRCHGLKNPDNYSKKNWDRNVQRMAKRAGLTKKELESIMQMKK